jgi:sensor histidine kinase YesM
MSEFWKQYLYAILLWNPLVCAAIELATGNYQVYGESFVLSLFISFFTASFCIFILELYISLFQAIKAPNISRFVPVTLRHKFVVTSMLLSPGLYISNFLARLYFSDLKPMNGASFLVSGYFYAGIIILIIYFTYSIAEFKKKKSQYTLENQSLRLKMQELEIENLKAKINSLSSQMNPHFLFNSLNSIAATINEQPEIAEKMVVKLSSLYRRILVAVKNDFHSLEDEILICTDYISIEKIRFEDRLNTNISLIKGLDLEEIRIPVLLIQTLIENSIKHGIAPKPNGGHVNLILENVANRLIIIVQDSGEPLNEYESNHKKNGEQMTFQNCKDRLSLFYPENHLFKIDINPKGSSITIELDLTPLRQKLQNV